MILISAHKIEKSFGSKTLFTGISFGIETGDRIGLIGPNGAGKSTLLKILSQTESLDDGELSFQKSLKIACLEQTPVFKDTDTIESAIYGSMKEDDYEKMGNAEHLISLMELDPTDNQSFNRHTLVNKLSGGWKKKVALARELMKEPQLLLLDEPTNHLDLESIFWLEEFLSSQRELAILTVTHDRLFLQKVSNQIFDLDRKYPDGLLKIKGTYSDYLEARGQFLSGQISQEEARRNDLVRETAWLRRGAQGRHTKQKARIERAFELKDEVLELRSRNQNLKLDLELANTGRSPKKLIEAKGIKKTFGNKVLFKDFDLIVSPKSRLGLLGRNGCGKSTLIKTLLGELKPDEGEVKIYDEIKVNYFEQQREALDPKKTLFKTLCPDGDYVHLHGTPVFARSYLSRFKFRPEQYDMPVKNLSGGEQARLLIAQLMLSKANILVLDEPTNDLDINTLDVLKEALDAFEGAVILVTHDRFFLEQAVDTIISFTEDGNLLSFAGYFQWESWQKSQGQKSTQKQSVTSTQSNAASESLPPAQIAEESKSPKRKLSFKEQRELDSMESTIHGKEQKLKELEAESQTPTVTSNSARLTEITQEMSGLQQEIDRLYSRWSELTS